MRTVLMAVFLGVVACQAFGEDLPPVSNGNGTTLRDLVNSDKLVTVVLKDSGAVDHNLRVIDIGPNYFSVTSPDEERIAYLFSSVQEVRIQDDKVSEKVFNAEESRSLRAEEKKVVDRAIERVRELFEAKETEQEVRCAAAMLLAVDGQKDGVEYLVRYAASNDLASQLAACQALYLAGSKESAATTIAKGLASGDRTVRKMACDLAGLVQDTASTGVLLEMLHDRAEEISAPAAVALGRLGCREAIPQLLKIIMEISEVKGAAAVDALAHLGGQDVIDQVKAKLPSAQHRIRFRLIVLLYTLKDAEGIKLLKEESMGVPTLAPEASLLLAKEGDWAARQYLTNRIRQRFNETPENLRFHADAAVALIEGGDTTAISHLQDLLRTDNAAMRIQICGKIAALGKRRLIPIIQPIIESPDPLAAISGCMATLSMAKPDFHERYQTTLIN